MCSFLRKNKIDLCILCKSRISTVSDVLIDRSNIYFSMFGSHICEPCGLYIINPLIQLLSIEFLANDHILVTRCSFDTIFDFQVIGTYFPNDNHPDYIVDAILNTPSFPIELFIGNFNASSLDLDIKNCHSHFFDSRDVA